MKVLVIGAAGMIGRKLCQKLARDGRLAGQTIEEAHLADVVAPAPFEAPFPIVREACDIAASYVAPKLAALRADVIFLLASVVSGEAEADFDKGYAINLDGTRCLVRGDPARAGPLRRRLSPAPRLHLVDRGLRRAVSRRNRRRIPCRAADELRNAKSDLRVAARPTIRGAGFSTGSASGCRRFASGPARRTRRPRASSRALSASRLSGKEAILPVGDEVRHWHASPRSAVGFLLRAAELDTALLGDAPHAQPARACRPRSASRSRRCGRPPAKRRSS